MADAQTQAAPLRQRREAVVYFDPSHPTSACTSPKSPQSFFTREDSDIDGFHDFIASSLEPRPDDCRIFACLSPARSRREAATFENLGSGVFPAVTLFSASSTGSEEGSEPVHRRRRAAEPLDSMGSGAIPADLHSDADADTAVVARPSVIIQEDTEFATAVNAEEDVMVSRTGTLVIVCKEDAE